MLPNMTMDGKTRRKSAFCLCQTWASIADCCKVMVEIEMLLDRQGTSISIMPYQSSSISISTITSPPSSILAFFCKRRNATCEPFWHNWSQYVMHKMSRQYVEDKTLYSIKFNFKLIDYMKDKSGKFVIPTSYLLLSTVCLINIYHMSTECLLDSSQLAAILLNLVCFFNGSPTTVYQVLLNFY